MWLAHGPNSTMNGARSHATQSSTPAPRTGLRVIAAFEALKAIAVIAAGFGLLTLLHENLQAMAETWITHFHLNPASRYPRIFLSLAARIGDTQLWLLAAGAAAYASLRLLEAYGLWRDRAWASWLGAVSGAIYVPIELFELVERVTAVRVATFAINLAIVGYLVLRLRRRA